MASWRAWVLAVRVPTLTAAVAPVLVGTAVAARQGQFRPWGALGALVVSLCIQVGTNLHNDVLDFLRGADTTSRRGPARATQSGLLTPKQAAAGAYVWFGVAGAVGLAFAARYGWPVVAAGLLAIAAGLGYTGGPWPIGYHGFGELFVFLFFGLLAVAGTTYVQAGSVSVLAIAAAVPVGLLATAIIVVNNLRDLETDRAAGKRTLAVRIGERRTRGLYLGCLVGAGIVPVVMRCVGLVEGWFWLPWLTVPLGVALIRAVWRVSTAAEYNRSLRRTAALHLLFAMLLAASLV
ncbi:MAG TPA: 1,4-dihydroxy-2-naphthoate polyprenyltransferase [bacterium]|nr:1,4-dihydroxy-2-naphthoate polyprenyltransferase [bacterium]